MGSLYLYSGVDLNNKYNDVFQTQALLESYLDTRTLVASFTNTNYYLKLQGELNIQIGIANVLSAEPNYFKYTDDTALSPRYYFIKSYEFHNGVLRIQYLLDVWHSYVDVIGIKGCHRYLTGVSGGAAQWVQYTTDPIYVMRPELTALFSSWMVIGMGYTYSATTSTSGTPSDATAFFTWPVSTTSDGSSLNSMSSPAIEGLGTTPNGLGTLATALSYARQLYDGCAIYRYQKANSSSGSGQTAMYSYMTNVYIIPASILTQTSSTFAAQAPTPLQDYRGLNAGILVNNADTAGSSSTVVNYQAFPFYQAPWSNSTYRDYTAMYWYPYAEYDGTINATSTNGSTLWFGTLAHRISIPVGLQSEPLTYRLRLELSAMGISLTLFFAGATEDITSDFELTFNYTPEQALAADTRKQNAKVDTWNMVSSMGSAIGSAGSQAALGGMGMASSAAAGSSIAGSATGMGIGLAGAVVDMTGSIGAYVTKRKMVYSDVQPGTAYTAMDQIRWGICYATCTPSNQKDIDANTKVYGYICDYSEAELSLVTSGNYTIAGCDMMQITGPIPEDYKQYIETMLQKGIRIWRVTGNNFLDYGL